MGLFEEKKDSAIFEFGVDETAKAYLIQTARWTKFMAIAGFIATGLMLFAGCAFFAMRRQQQFGTATSTALTVGYLVIGLVYIFPTIELFRFSNKLKRSFSENNSQYFNDAMRHQRNMWQYLGILVIALVVMYGGIIAFAATMR